MDLTNEDKAIKKELTKSIILFSILVLAIIVYAFMNYHYESKFKEEFMLPGATSEGF